MNKITREYHQRVCAAADLVAIVAADLPRGLRKSGAEYLGLCPWHHDQHASLAVVPAKNLWHCPVCDRTGDAVKWIQVQRNMPYRQAVRQLADLVGEPWIFGATQIASRPAPQPAPLPLNGHPHPHHKPHPKPDADPQRYRTQAINQARGLWAQAAGGPDRLGVNHPRVAAYIEARGIPLALLPTARVPAAIRYLANCPREEHLDKITEITVPPERIPALVCAVVTYDRRVAGVQRIYLDPHGADCKVQYGQAKRSRGSMSAGGAVRLSAPDANTRTLYLTEGIETGLAVLAALRSVPALIAKDGRGPAVWSVVSHSGYANLVLGPAEAGDPDAGQAATSTPAPTPPTPREPQARGWIDRIVICADYNRPKLKSQPADSPVTARVGTASAIEALKRLRQQWPHLQVGYTAPNAACIPERIAPDGSLIEPHKAADWLDVLNLRGPDATAQAIVANLVWLPDEPTLTSPHPAPATTHNPPAPPAPPAGGGHPPRHAATPPPDRPYMPEHRGARARQILAHGFGALPNLDPQAQAFRLARFGGQWYVYDPAQIADHAKPWVAVNPEMIEGQVGLMCEDHDHLVANELVAFGTTGRTVTDILKLIVPYVAVAHSDLLPTWLPADFDASGPTFTPRTRRPVAGPIPAHAVVACADGLVNVDAWMQGRLHVEPWSSRWFSVACCPLAVPRSLLADVAPADEDQAALLVTPHCPNWINFLTETLSADQQQIDTLQEWFGYSLTSDIKHHKIMWLQGSPGSGKGTIREVLTAILGDDGVAMTTLRGLTDRFSAASWVGRNALFIPELRAGPSVDMQIALDTILMISGGDPIACEQKHAAVKPTCRMTCKVMATPNYETTLKDAAGALQRRLLVLRTADPPPNRQADTGLVPKLKAEIEAIFVWAMVGLRRLERRGRFVQPNEGKGLLDAIIEAGAPVKSFVDDCCVVGPGNCVAKAVLFEQFRLYLEGEGDDSGSRWLPQTFSQHLRALPLRVSMGQVRIGSAAGDEAGEAPASDRVRVYHGVRPRLTGIEPSVPYRVLTPSMLLPYLKQV